MTNDECLMTNEDSRVASGRDGETGKRSESLPGIHDPATRPLVGADVAGDDSVAARTGDGRNERITQGQWTACPRRDFAPDCGGTHVEFQNPVTASQTGCKLTDPFMIGMAGRQQMKSLPNLGQGDGGDEQMSRILDGMPAEHADIGTRFSEFADHVGVQHEVHKDTRRTESGGIRGGSQSVVPRMESYQAVSWRMVRRDLWLRRDRLTDGRRFPERVSRASQWSNSLAWLSDKPLTFLTASSTELIT